jgi:hypothetical protein
MPRPDETFIVRVRERNGDAVVEQPRRARRRRIRDLAEVGDLIAHWLEADHQRSTQTDLAREATARAGTAFDSALGRPEEEQGC